MLTARPVGAIPGSIQSISVVCVKSITNRHGGIDVARLELAAAMRLPY
jgi:hypothetical protein